MQQQIIVSDPATIRGIVADVVGTLLTAHLTPPPPTAQALTEGAFLTRGETLRLLRISAPTLRDMARRRELCPIRVGRKLLFRRSDIEALAATGGRA